MPTLLLSVLLLQIVIHIINTVGATVINEFLWTLYTQQLPTSNSQNSQRQLEFRKEVIRLKREMAATSSQDEFAKWAKIRRTHDKAVSQYDEVTEKVKATRNGFNTTASVIRFVCTNGLRLFLQFYYSRQPMYWIPAGWAPYYVEWILSFPRAPIGSVSIQIWGIACASVIEVIADGLVGIIGLVQESSLDRRKTAMKMKSGAGEKKEERKEL